MEAEEASSRSEDRRRPPWSRYSYTGSNQMSSNFSKRYCLMKIIIKKLNRGGLSFASSSSLGGEGGSGGGGGNDCLLYPSGCGIALFDTKEPSAAAAAAAAAKAAADKPQQPQQRRQQRLVPLADRGRHLTALTVNKDRRLLAFAERGDR